VYLDDEDIKESRDPEHDGSPEELRLDYLLPTGVALTIGKRYGKSLVLDTKDSGCFVFIVCDDIRTSRESSLTDRGFRASEIPKRD
jgi:hypothetical protein